MDSSLPPKAPGQAPAATPEEAFFPESWVRPQTKFIEVQELPPDAAWAEWEAAIAAQEGGGDNRAADFPATQVMPLE